MTKTEGEHNTKKAVLMQHDLQGKARMILCSEIEYNVAEQSEASTMSPTHGGVLYSTLLNVSDRTNMSAGCMTVFATVGGCSQSR